jgi:hypothetical protein
VINGLPISYFSIWSQANIWLQIQIIRLLVIQSSALTYFLIPLRPRYSPQHPILEHPQLTFLPQCEGPSFTPIQKTDKL